MSKKSCFRRPFDKQYGKRAQTLSKPASQHLYHFHESLPSQLSCKKSLLLACQFLVQLVNTTATAEKEPELNRNNLAIPIQMQLSPKQKNFSEIFPAFAKSRLNFKHFEKKDNPHSSCIFEGTDS